jgi:hypothetical protein
MMAGFNSEDNFSKVVNIAKKIRETFENIEIEICENKSYTCEPKLDLGGYCGRASVQMFLACKRAGISGVELWDVDDGYHTFNMYGDRIIDITATQFDENRPAVYTPLARNVNSYEEYRNADRQRNHLKNWIYRDYMPGVTIRKDNIKVRKALGF